MGMMRQAERNNLKMAAILQGFEQKLKFMTENEQRECPVCLEDFDKGLKQSKTLGCCHKVCNECWNNWSKVMNGRPFCPLCRHDDFVGVVAGRASTGDSG